MTEGGGGPGDGTSRLRVRLLGTSAGGGLPQWNCGCPNCAASREGTLPQKAQSSLAISADGERWVLVNASPDVRQQVQWLAPTSGRGSRIAAVVLTSADVDHTAGLFVLREGGAPPIYATPPVLRALDVGLGVALVLSAFGRIDLRPLTVGAEVLLAGRDGGGLGLDVRVVPLAGRPPPYMRLRGEPTDANRGDTVALAFRAEGGSKTVLYAPGVAAVSEELEAEARRASVLLVDGTCFSNDETQELAGRTSADMGHVTMDGDGGSLAWLAKHEHARRIYVHVNNTNPVIMPGSEARRKVESLGVEVGDDGLELTV